MLCKACFRPHWDIFTLFGYWVGGGGGGGGGSQGMGTQPAYAVFHSGQLQNRSFQNLFF